MEELGPTQLWSLAPMSVPHSYPFLAIPRQPFLYVRKAVSPAASSLQNTEICGQPPALALDLRGWTSEFSDWHLSNQKGRGTKRLGYIEKNLWGKNNPALGLGSLGVEGGVCQSNPVTGRN